MRRVAAALLLCALALGLAACGERAEPTAVTVDLYPVTVGSAGGGETVLDGPPQRIAALDEPMLATLRALRPQGTVTRRNGLADADLVAGWSSGRGAARVDGREPENPSVYLAADRSVADVEASLDDLGVLVNRPLTARDFVTSIRSDVARVTRAVDGRPDVSVFLDTGFFTTVSTRSIAGDEIRLAGGRSVAGAAPESGPFDLRELQRLNPRWYIASSDSGTTLRQLRRNPLTKELDAVKAGRFAVVPARLLQPGPEVGEAVVRFARILHRDAPR